MQELESAKRLLERCTPGSENWDTALAELTRTTADPNALSAIAAKLTPSDARRFLTAHVIAATIRAKDVRSGGRASANRVLAEAQALCETYRVSPGLFDYAKIVATTAASLLRLRGPNFHVRARVWEACFGASLYEAPWHAIDLRDQSVMVLGETGTGKELVADTIGTANLWFQQTLKEDPYSDANGVPSRHPPTEPPLIKYNAGALASSLAEGELFGSLAGSFTGAISSRLGLLPAAHGGAIFLDEIGDLGADLLAKLLRAIEEQEIHPLGGNPLRPMKVCTRWITATSKNLDALIATGAFTEDLRRRLSGLIIEIPPLRSWEVEEVRDFAREQLLSPRSDDDHGAVTGVNNPSYVRRLQARFDEELGPWLLETPRSWPGNVRQLIQLVVAWRVQSRDFARALLEQVPVTQGTIVPTTTSHRSKLDRLVSSGEANLEQARAWYIARSRRPGESAAKQAQRLGADPGTIRSYARLAHELEEQ